jgi:hypothetical protein
MARPRKSNADYFSHDNDMRNDDKILAVRNKYQHLGYAIWCMLLEKLCKADNFKVKFSDKNIELMAGDFRVEFQLLKQVFEYFIEVDLIQKKENFIFSKELIDRFQGLLDKRNYDRQWFQGTKTKNKEVSVTENTQSIVKYNKVNNKPPIVPLKKGGKPKHRKFIKPIIEEIKSYCRERNNTVDADKFFNHYESNGWRVGKNPMKDWRAAVRTWENSEFNNNRKPVLNKETIAKRKLQDIKEQEHYDKVMSEKPVSKEDAEKLKQQMRLEAQKHGLKIKEEK